MYWRVGVVLDTAEPAMRASLVEAAGESVQMTHKLLVEQMTAKVRAETTLRTLSIHSQVLPVLVAVWLRQATSGFMVAGLAEEVEQE